MQAGQKPIVVSPEAHAKAKRLMHKLQVDSMKEAVEIAIERALREPAVT